MLDPMKLTLIVLITSAIVTFSLILFKKFLIFHKKEITNKILIYFILIAIGIFLFSFSFFGLINYSKPLPDMGSKELKENIETLKIPSLDEIKNDSIERQLNQTKKRDDKRKKELENARKEYDKFLETGGE